MSCCCVTRTGAVEDIRSRKRLGSKLATDAARLVGEAEEEDEGDRSKMDISVLREQYRWTTERQRHQTQVLLFRRVSEELSEAVSVVPVNQGLMMSSCSSLAASPPNLNSKLSPMTFDPWHVHLGLHRRACLGVTAHCPHPATTNTSSSYVRSSSVSEAGSSQQEVADSKPSVKSATDSLNSSNEISPSSSFNMTEEDHFDGSFNSTKEDKIIGSFDSSKVDPIQASLNVALDIDSPFAGSKGRSVNGSFNSSQEDSIAGSLTSSEESSTPVGSIACSPTTDEEVKKNKENMPANWRSNNSNQWCSSTSAQVSTPGLQLTRQMSFGGLQSPLGPLSGADLHQHYYPFPHRKTPRKSEAARKLGMYSSF